MVQFKFRSLNMEDIKKIAHWKYNPQDEPFYVEPYLECHREGKELRGPKNSQGFACLSEDNKLAGLFEYSFDEQGVMEIGCAFHPEWKGKGLGKDFVLQGMAFGIQHFNYGLSKVRLVVSVENHPAIAVYRKCGFIQVQEVEEWGEPSLLMEKSL